MHSIQSASVLCRQLCANNQCAKTNSTSHAAPPEVVQWASVKIYMKQLSAMVDNLVHKICEHGTITLHTQAGAG